MKLEIPHDLLKLLKKRGPKTEILIQEDRWQRHETYQHTDFHADDIDALLEITKERERAVTAKGVVTDKQELKDLRALIRKLNAVVKLRNGGKKFVNLELLADAIVETIKGTTRGWVFVEDKITKEPSPYLVTECVFHEAYRDRGTWRPAYVQCNAKAIRRGHEQKTQINILRETLLDGMTPEQALVAKGWVLESPEALAAHDASLQAYDEMSRQVGKQLAVVGQAKLVPEDKDDDGWRSWWRAEKPVEVGNPGRAVIDDDEGWGEDEVTVTVSGRFSRFEEEDEEEDQTQTYKVVKLPVHPYIRCFDLRHHRYIETHVDNVGFYIYDRNLFNRLVLAEDYKELIDALVVSEKQGDDLVAGKGKGVIILLSGPPGVGKTLTAELYCERAQMPLYTVQCAQLGTDAQELETRLATALNRATKWGAGLLIDEGDVYIRDRGNDVQHNAIVGVFLRLLEYYKGVLFITTNREQTVDDAILSRVVAHVRYRAPTKQQAAALWTLMAGQFHLPLAPALVEELVNEFSGISGRSVKQLTRLAKTMSERLNRPVNLELFRWLAQFQDLGDDMTH